MNSKANIHDKTHWLIRTGCIDKTSLEQAQVSAANQNHNLVKYLVENGQADSYEIASAAASTFELPLVDLDAFDLQALPLTTVSDELARKHRAIPLHKQDNILQLGISDPASQDSFSEIRFHSGCKTEPLIVEEAKLNQLLMDLLDTRTGNLSAGTSLQHDDFHEILTPDPGNHLLREHEQARETPVTRLVNKILIDAIRKGASDIHIENFEHSLRIRYRLDGLLREIARPPSAVTEKICARLKVMARLNIAEKRLPQDGRFKLSLSRTRSMDFRVNTLPTLWGEKTVLRLLDSGLDKLDLDHLGFNADQKRLYQDALEKQQGLILVTGPTGSGKSMTLYTGLNLLNTQERNIASVEDPVELHLEGINQVPVNAAIGLDFANAARAFLRQDPDVLMVGEIRDPETAMIALKAAQTGHLVLSTLHTNSAPATLARLLDMGIAPYQLATSLSLVIAQRLVRRLCHRCKKPLQLTTKDMICMGFSEDQAANARLFGPVGCHQCQGGYQGRIGIYEIVAITGDISRVIMNGGNSIQIAELATKAGFNDLHSSALEKAAQGQTSLAEINRVI